MAYPYPRLCLVLLALAASALLSCTSRTLPLPPPGDVEAEALADQPGMARVSGFASEDASIGILNDETLTGVITASDERDCGRRCPFEATLEAEAGDPLRVWQFRRTPNAEPIYVESP